MKVVKRAKPHATARVPLTRERVLKAAIRLADRSGIDSVSMRKLGEAVGVEAMSLYNHVRNKEDMLDGMVDIVFSEIDLPANVTDWRTAMRQRALSARQALLRHPWALGLMESRAQPGVATLRHHDAVIGTLRKAGFSVELAAHAYSVLDGYVYGFTLTELTLPFRDGTGVVEVGTNMLRQFPTNEFPYLGEMIQHAIQPGYSYGAEFEYGLDLILDGLSRARER